MIKWITVLEKTVEKNRKRCVLEPVLRVEIPSIKQVHFAYHDVLIDGPSRLRYDPTSPAKTWIETESTVILDSMQSHRKEFS